MVAATRPVVCLAEEFLNAMARLLLLQERRRKSVSSHITSMKFLYEVILVILLGMIGVLSFVAVFMGDTEAAKKKQAPRGDFGWIAFAGAVYVVLFLIAVVLGWLA